MYNERTLEPLSYKRACLRALPTHWQTSRKIGVMYIISNSKTLLQDKVRTTLSLTDLPELQVNLALPGIKHIIPTSIPTKYRTVCQN